MGRRRGGRSLKGLSDRRNSQSVIELWRGSTPGNEPAKSNTWLSARFTSRQMSSSGVGLNIWRASPCFNVCDRGIWCFPLPNTYQMTILVSTQIQSKAKVGENFYCWRNLGSEWKLPASRTQRRRGENSSCDSWHWHHVLSSFWHTTRISGFIWLDQFNYVFFHKFIKRVSDDWVDTCHTVVWF